MWELALNVECVFDEWFPVKWWILVGIQRFEVEPYVWFDGQVEVGFEFRDVEVAFIGFTEFDVENQVAGSQ